MKKSFSAHWQRSKQPRKQRKYLSNAPLHVHQRMVAAPLAEALQKKYQKKTAHIRKGDMVTIMRGQFRGQRGKIEKVDLKRMRLFIENAQIIKHGGTKVYYPVHPSKVRIEDLVLDDKRRKALFEVKKA